MKNIITKKYVAVTCPLCQRAEAQIISVIGKYFQKVDWILGLKDIKY